MDFTVMLTSRQLSQGEEITGMSTQITPLFQRYDTNQDGVIGAWELKAMIDAGDIIIYDDLTVSLSVIGLPTLPPSGVPATEPPPSGGLVNTFVDVVDTVSNPFS
jgi:hypothetical protein